jgi:hypothetical protein
MEQLAAEKASRLKDGDTIAIEAVIQKSQVAFEAPQQTLGRAVLALFCGTATSPDGFTIIHCEYPTLEQAARGAAEIKAVRGATSRWTFKARKKSTLEVVARSDAKKESVDAVLAAFEAL